VDTIGVCELPRPPPLHSAYAVTTPSRHRPPPNLAPDHVLYSRPFETMSVRGTFEIKKLTILLLQTIMCYHALSQDHVPTGHWCGVFRAFLSYPSFVRRMVYFSSGLKLMACFLPGSPLVDIEGIANILTTDQ
jgi:hypothetical protein